MFQKIIEFPAGEETPRAEEALSGLRLLQGVVVVKKVKDDSFV